MNLTIKKGIRELQRYEIFSSICLLFLLTACAGDGIGLNDFGEPIDTSDVVVPVPQGPTLESIQADIFSAICAFSCHALPNPEENLNLEDGEAYDNLVNVPSEQRPLMMRIDPGYAENSYLVWKLEDRAGILNNRMPLNRARLPDEQIEAIKTWINEGALP